jgi:hypothetical protein
MGWDRLSLSGMWPKSAQADAFLLRSLLRHSRDSRPAAAAPTRGAFWTDAPAAKIAALQDAAGQLRDSEINLLLGDVTSEDTGSCGG